MRRRTILSKNIKAALAETLRDHPSSSLGDIRQIVEHIVGESLEFGHRRKFFLKVLQKHFPKMSRRKIQRRKVKLRWGPAAPAPRRMKRPLQIARSDSPLRELREREAMYFEDEFSHGLSTRVFQTITTKAVPSPASKAIPTKALPNVGTNLF